jgi:hypothetical protein
MTAVLIIWLMVVISRIVRSMPCACCAADVSSSCKAQHGNNNRQNWLLCGCQQ